MQSFNPMIHQFAIIFGIAILYPMLIYFGVDTYQPLPKTESVVIASVIIAPRTSEEWRAWEEKQRIAEQRHQEHLAALDKASQPFFRTLLIVSVPLGLAAIFVGSVLPIHSVGAGL